MKPLRTILFCVFCVFCVNNSIAQTWDEANAAYADKQYEDAIQIYDSILATTPSADVYYNLGNAYFKQGNIAQAILAYERCLRLSPRHQDAQFNLAFAESRIVDNIEDNHQFFVVVWAQHLRNWMLESTWLTIAVILFILALVGMMLFAFSPAATMRKTAFYSGLFAFVLSMMALWCGLSLHHRNVARNEAIITQATVNAKASPDKSGTDLFVLHAGTKVRITDTIGEWHQVEVGPNKGWLRINTIERI